MSVYWTIALFLKLLQGEIPITLAFEIAADLQEWAF